MSKAVINIKKCSSEADFELAMTITRAYVDSLGIDLSFQDVDHEMAHFPTMYGPPKGAYLLGDVDGRLGGGVGLRELTDDQGEGHDQRLCEMKRLFVYDDFRGTGLGKVLCERVIALARELNYAHMRLDTLVNMEAARQLYARLGFYPIEAYRFNPEPGTSYMQLDL